MSQLTVATYNIHGCLGWDRRIDPARIGAVIRHLGADLVAVQEVIDQPDSPSALRQLARLSGLTGFDAVAGPTLLRPDTPCGTALLTRLPVLDVRRHDLSLPRREPRGALDVDVKTPFGPLRVIATHLGLRRYERRYQIERLLEILNRDSQPCTLLLGDINEWFPRAGGLRLLERYFGPAPAPRSFPARLPLLALDRIWAHPTTELDVSVYTSALARAASDHLPVRARLRFARHGAEPR